MVRPIADGTMCAARDNRADKRRTWKALRYGAKSWGTQRRMVARIEATTSASTSATSSLAARKSKYLYETVYCGTWPGRELHQAAQGPTRLRSHVSCRDPRANQFALNLLHTAAYWLLHTLRFRRTPSARCRRARNSTRCVCFDQDRMRVLLKQNRTHSRLAADSLSRRRDVQTPRWPLRRHRTVSAGAHAPR